jgi:hypothetical protein
MKGNIIVNSTLDVELIAYANNTKQPRVNYSDYNVFQSAFKLIGDRYNSVGGTKVFDSLSQWNAATASQLESLNINNPDANSITADAAVLFIDAIKGNYRLASGSPAIGVMPDGSNAGPYQSSSEIIGLLPGLPAPVINNLALPPSSFSGTVVTPSL